MDKRNKKTSEQTEKLKTKITDKPETDDEAEEIETSTKTKRGRDQPSSPNKNNTKKKKKRQPTNLSWAKQRNPFFK